MSELVIPEFLRDSAVTVKSFKELRKAMQDSLDKSLGDAEIVCAPIEGGYGSVEANLLKVRSAQEILANAGYPVWNHLPFMASVVLLRKAFKERYKRSVYAHPEHDDVYAPLYTLKPPIIKKVWLLEDPQVFGVSQEVRWHQLQCAVSGIETKVFNPRWHQKPELLKRG